MPFRFTANTTNKMKLKRRLRTRRTSLLNVGKKSKCKRWWVTIIFIDLRTFYNDIYMQWYLHVIYINFKDINNFFLWLSFYRTSIITLGPSVYEHPSQHKYTRAISPNQTWYWAVGPTGRIMCTDMVHQLSRITLDSSQEGPVCSYVWSACWYVYWWTVLVG